MMYGYLTHKWFPIFGCYLFDDLIELSYLAIYWQYTTERSHFIRVFAVALSAMNILPVSVIVGGLDYTAQTRDQVGSVLGYICGVVAVCLYGAPMEKLFHVLKYKSAVFINVHIVIAGTTNNCLWFTYGLLAKNWFSVLPSILLVVIGIFTLVLYATFNPKTHPQSATFYQATGDTTHTAGEGSTVSISVELTSAASTCVKSMKSPRGATEVDVIRSPLQSVP